MCEFVEADYLAPVRAGAWWSAATRAGEGESEKEGEGKDGHNE